MESTQANVGATSVWGLPNHIYFASLVAVSIPLFWSPLRTLADYSLRTGQHEFDKYSHALLIPLISALLVWRERNRAFRKIERSYAVGGLMFFTALSLDALPRIAGWPRAEGALSLQLPGLALFWAAAFISCYGTQAAGAMRFPLLFLLLMVPLPNVILDPLLKLVQFGSAEFCSATFSVFGVPFMRDGFVFTLPAVSIEVAKECSGIHSSIALFIVSLIAAYLFLSSLWARTLLAVCVVPVVSLSNGVRIAGLSLLASYIDPGFLYGSLHRQGGAAFFLLALSMLYLVLRLLRRLDRGTLVRGQPLEGSDGTIAPKAA